MGSKSVLGFAAYDENGKSLHPAVYVDGVIQSIEAVIYITMGKHVVRFGDIPGYTSKNQIQTVNIYSNEISQIATCNYSRTVSAPHPVPHPPPPPARYLECLCGGKFQTRDQLREHIDLCARRHETGHGIRR